VNSITAHTKVTSLDHTASVQQVLDVMMLHNFAAVPIRSSQAGSEDYFGVVTTLDIALALTKSPDGDSVLRSAAVNLMGTRNVLMLNGMDTLRTAIELLVTEGLHHLLVVGTDDKSSLDQTTPLKTSDSSDVSHVHMLAQSDVIRAMNEEDAGLDQVLNLSLEDADIVKATPMYVLSVKESTLAIDALRMLGCAVVSAVAIVDDDGKLVGSLSAADLRGLTESTVSWLHTLPVMEFLQRQHGLVRPPVTCDHKATLKTVVKFMTDNRTHRLWVTDNGVPDGIVTMTDVLRMLVPGAPRTPMSAEG